MANSSGFVTRVGHQLMLENGQALYVNGWNSYWLMVTASDGNTRSRVDAVLRDGAALGLTVCRTWAFNDDTYQALQKSPGVYDEKVFQVPTIVRTFLGLPRLLLPSMQIYINPCYWALEHHRFGILKHTIFVSISCHRPLWVLMDEPELSIDRFQSSLWLLES